MRCFVDVGHDAPQQQMTEGVAVPLMRGFAAPRALVTHSRAG
jgi:hypothetical protein